MVSPRVDLTSKTHTNRNLKKNNWNKNSQVTRIKWLVFLTYTHARTHTRVRQWVDEDSETKFMEKRLKLN